MTEQRKGRNGAWGSPLTALASLRPFFIAAALASFMFAFYRLQLKNRDLCFGRCLQDTGSSTPPTHYFLDRDTPRGSADGVPALCHVALLTADYEETIGIRRRNLMVAFSALAPGSRTATLDVTGMDCPVCPITVRKAIEKVPAVSSVKVDFKTKRAVVLFDPAKTVPDALTKATADAGYPSTVKQVQ